MVYVGIESYIDGMTNAVDKFYSENNLQDLNVIGYFLNSWLFEVCLDDNFYFNVYINISTYIIATIGTFLVHNC